MNYEMPTCFWCPDCNMYHLTDHLLLDHDLPLQFFVDVENWMNGKFETAPY